MKWRMRGITSLWLNLFLAVLASFWLANPHVVIEHKSVLFSLSMTTAILDIVFLSLHHTEKAQESTPKSRMGRLGKLALIGLVIVFADSMAIWHLQVKSESAALLMSFIFLMGFGLIFCSALAASSIKVEAWVDRKAREYAARNPDSELARRLKKEHAP